VFDNSPNQSSLNENSTDGFGEHENDGASHAVYEQNVQTNWPDLNVDEPIVAIINGFTLIFKTDNQVKQVLLNLKLIIIIIF
jgi:hypothetical protein